MAKAIKKNSEKDVAEAVEVEETETEEEVEEVKEELPTVDEEAEATVKVKVKEKVESYIGNKYYRFLAGEEYDVPKNVKDILKSAGYLEAI